MVAPRAFGEGPFPNAIDHVMRQYVLVYIMALIGNVLFLYKLGLTFAYLYCLYFETLRRSAPSRGVVSL